MEVACAADAAYVPYCAAMLHSLLALHPDAAITVNFLHPPGLPEDALARLRRLVEGQPGAALRSQAIAGERLAGLPVSDYFGPAMWYRLFLPELLPGQERVLYLDVDTLVVDRLDALWLMPLQGRCVAAVDNVVEPGLQPRITALDLPQGCGYFNSGVLLIDLERMRLGLGERVRQIACARGAGVLWPDQDALNLALAAERLSLHPRWNCQNSLYFWRGLAERQFGREPVAEALARPAIWHFEGPGLAKPWHYLNKHPARRRWWRHMRHSGFPLPPVLGRDAFSIWLKPLPPAWIAWALRLQARLRRLRA
jgi:lipopolysaccharide biosynthesis glycosyltransferase